MDLVQLGLACLSFIIALGIILLSVLFIYEIREYFISENDSHDFLKWILYGASSILGLISIPLILMGLGLLMLK